MKQTRAPFMPVTPDVDDDALETLAREKGVGSLVKPERAGEGTPTTTAPSSTARAPSPATSTSPSAVTRDTDEGTPRSRMKSVNIDLPDYAWTELKILAAREQVSVRHIIMRALNDRGIKITAFDLVEDGRRLRT